MTPTLLDPRLPGADLVAAGLEDLSDGRLTPVALLIAAAAPRLRDLGIPVPVVPVEAPLHRLYALLAEEEPADAHARLNALIGRVVSFARAAEHAAAG